MKYRKEILSIIKPNTILFIKYWQDWKMSNHSASIKWKNKACGEFSIWSDEAKPVLNSVLVFKQRNKAKKILIFINPSKILLIQYWLQSQYLHRKAWKCQTTQLLTLTSVSFLKTDHWNMLQLFLVLWWLLFVSAYV